MRIGGHTKGASYRHFPANVASLGIEQAVRIAQLEYNTIKATHLFARSNGIACDSWEGDTVDIIYSASQWEEARSGVEALQAAMPNHLQGAARYELLNEAEARNLYHCKGSQKIYGAVRYEAGSLSAYKFVCGLLQMCLDKGMQFHTETPVTALLKASDGTWNVHSDRGIVNANQVVLATNGYTAALMPRMIGSIVPLRGQITAHRPGRAMPNEGLKTTYSFIYPEGYEYMISRPVGSTNAGDIIIGGGLGHAPQGGLLEYGTTDDTALNPVLSEYLRDTTSKYFGDAWGEDDSLGRIRCEWNGIMGYSPDGFPFIGEVPEEQNLFISASFQGHGMVLCFLCAQALVTMMTGCDNQELRDWFPKAFRISSERLKIKFKGRLHVRAPELEVEAQ